ncbi:MAG: hypothetical protein JRD69_07160 [Deltaproteobacteria bacterium]|nr:hypothetical protein [Deltaproteobacteria bacterium]
MIINCIDDSHASFFSGFDCIIPEWPQNGNCYFKNIKAYRIGPVLAYSLHRRWHKGRRLLFKIVKTLNPQNDVVMLCFGEIDCRTHIVKQARSKNTPIEKVVELMVNKYFSVITKIKWLGFNVWVWNVILPQKKDIKSEEYSSVGTYDERKQHSYLMKSSDVCVIAMVLGLYILRMKLVMNIIWMKSICRKKLCRL